MNMFPSSTSSSSSQERSGSGGGLMRYGSAPGSLLTAAVDSVIAGGAAAAHNEYSTQLAPSRFFPSCSDTNNNISDQSTAAAMPNLNDNVSTLTTNTNPNPNRNSNSNPNSNPNPNRNREQFSKANSAANAIGSSQQQQQRSNYGFPSGGGASSLVRHSSSPAGFLNQLATAASDINNNNGFCITSGIGSYNSKGIGDNGRGISRLNSQLSFTRKEGLSRISEETENGGDGFITDNNGQRKSSSHSYGFGMGSWDETNNPIIFSVAPSKRPKMNMNSDVDHTMESQFEFSMAQTLEMDAMDKLLHIPQDSVPCKIRAKRGCATHPRSIAERERRTRISGKLKKLQDLVPNMDKQTSYADMLDLAVQHIKSLQNQVQKLNKEVDNCTCGCSKNTTDS